MSYGQLAQTVIDTVKQYKGAAINVVIVGGTVALKKVVQNEKFRCPCVSPDNLGSCRSGSLFYNSTSECTKNVNLYYGLSHIIFPAIALYFVGMIATPRLWKIVTGCATAKPRASQRKRAIWPIILAVNVKALLAPFTWLIVMLLDGQYVACALTPLPYDVGKGKTYETCNDVANAVKVFTSDAFRTNEVISQIFGWFMFALIVGVGFVGFLFISSTSPMTYYHAKYHQIYRENEEFEINDEMKIKAQADAEANVRQFMSDRRSKEEWDEISQVYEYHKDKLHLSVWSCMHQWVLNQQNGGQTLPSNAYEAIEERSGNVVENIRLIPKSSK